MQFAMRKNDKNNLIIILGVIIWFKKCIQLYTPRKVSHQTPFCLCETAHNHSSASWKGGQKGAQAASHFPEVSGGKNMISNKQDPMIFFHHSRKMRSNHISVTNSLFVKMSMIPQLLKMCELSSNTHEPCFTRNSLTLINLNAKQKLCQT